MYLQCSVQVTNDDTLQEDKQALERSKTYMAQMADGKKAREMRVKPCSVG